MADDSLIFAYTACGLAIRSALELPGLMPDHNPPAQADLRISLADLSGPMQRAGHTAGAFYTTDDDVLFTAHDLGDVLVHKGTSIMIDPLHKAEGCTALRFSVLEPLLAIALYQRGRLVLHGSSAAIAGKGLALVGHSGSGKSTTAAALFRRGHRVLGDDIAVVCAHSAAARIFPGIPRLKLTHQAALELGHNPQAMAPVFLQPDKRALDTTRDFSTGPVPLNRVYILPDDPKKNIDDGPPALLRPEPQQALLELVRHSYRIRWLHSLSATEHLRQCAALVALDLVRVVTGYRPASDGPDAVAGLLETDMSRIPET